MINFVANKIQMKFLERIKNHLRLFSIKRNEAIYTCIQNDIPLTDENIKEVMGILKQKEQKELLEQLKKEN